ncbi:up-regulator of cell proliferation-like [Hyperolius riggenbachi]|uniref:up-regulator of cell proliferation-like n=1 Tax=Hyperolius riggenbachi TaxID=752182 RepID=UPI0035A3851D
MMKRTVRDVLLYALEDLESNSLHKFRRKLTDVEAKDGDTIPRGRLEKASADMIVDLLIDFYGASYSCDLTLEVLCHINERTVEERLRRDLGKVQRPTFLTLPSVRGYLTSFSRGLVSLYLSSGNTGINEPFHVHSCHTRSQEGVHPDEGGDLTDGSSRRQPEPGGDLTDGSSRRQPEPDKYDEFRDLVQRLNMTKFLSSKLTLNDVWSIGAEDLTDIQHQSVEDLPWCFLRKIMALNTTARNTEMLETHYENDLFVLSDLPLQCSVSQCIHPLDVLCVLLHCSDAFLQQEIVTRMAMCQFAVPLLLPAGDGSHCTLMMWSLRNIVKMWRPLSLADSKGFREECVLNISMPIFSFVRLGKTKLSKSKILNQILKPAQQTNDFFIHINMEGGNIRKKICDGMVEISWYFPSGKSDVFPQPIAVTNLRGDLESNWNQFMFLTRVSSAVFIFMESMSEREFTLLASCSTTNTQYYFIVTPGPGQQVSTETLKTFHDLSPRFKMIINGSDMNEARIVNKLQSRLIHSLNNDQNIISMRNLESETHGLPIYVDENIPECQKARQWANSITEEIRDVAEYKQKTMRLQGDLWRQISEVEKELCRMVNRGDKGEEQYLCELKQKHFLLHETQYGHDLPDSIVLFINAMTHLSENEKQYFLKWMKFGLDSVVRCYISTLEAEYREKYNKSINREELRKLDQRISEGSLGIEHFLREMGQLYEAECYMHKEKRFAESQRQFNILPGIAADLLLEGFPLELMDGDVLNIPLQWITDVLTQLDKKTGGDCRMRVISVLGVQGTGKSTLLNTMFGSQFPVASGKCSRGAFMTLLPVKKNFKVDLDCEFIMIVDTEGLKAPKLDSLKDSYEHDNELATLVTGLSDITLVNISMKITTEMHDILKIVGHVFLRMKEIRKKPNCQFVYQNVSDVFAYDKNMRDREKLLEQLNEITKVDAEMEKKSEIKAFSDVMDYDLEKDNWYIPGLWLGVPPMAPVNYGYSEQVYELKKYILTFLKSKKSQHKPLTIPDFVMWIGSLRNAVKHETFTVYTRKQAKFLTPKNWAKSWGVGLLASHVGPREPPRGETHPLYKKPLSIRLPPSSLGSRRGAICYELLFTQGEQETERGIEEAAK